MIEKNYDVKGMTCASCVSHVENAVKKLNGVKEVNVSLLTNSMTIKSDKDIKESIIVKAVSKAGYEVVTSNNIKELDKINDNYEVKKLAIIFTLSMILLIPLFYISMGYMMDWNIGVLKTSPFLLAIIELILTTLILYLNKRFYISGFKSLFHLSANMDSLVALSTSIAYIYSIIILIIMASLANFNSIENNLHSIMHYSMNLNFETAAMVVTLITFGKLLESISKGKTKDAIKKLMQLTSKTATRIKDDKEEIISSDDIQVDDILLIKPGEYFPVDGIIIKGNCSVDESSLTGESMPVFKEVNDKVKSGTINLNSTIKIKTIAVGKDTTLAKIIQMVEDASSSKAPIARIVDKISYYFVPTIMIFSIITFIVWISISKNFILNNPNINENFITYSLNKAISVLVIACPCALGLATPVAIMVSTGKGAKNGILFKNATSLENLSHADFIVFDKTGTLTKGSPQVIDILPLNNTTTEELLTIAYSLENSSNHPLAKAINTYCKENKIDIKQVYDFNEIAGKGVKGYIDKNLYSSLNITAIKELNYNINDEINNIYINYSKEGKTVLFFYKEKDIIGIITVADTLKEDAKETIQELKKLNIIPIMLTGDNKIVASKIAKDLSLDYFVASLLPEGKLEIVSYLQKFGKVIMVGDGINDSPSLTKADMSITVSDGSDIAIDSSDIILAKSKLMDIIKAIRLSKYTIINIKENLFFAFIYNIIMIPIAAGVFTATNNELLMNMKPYYGAAAMSLSSVSVVLNALRINLFDLNKSHKTRKKKKDIPDSFLSNYIDDKKEYVRKKILIDDISCFNCVNHISEVLKNDSNIKLINIDLDSKTAIIDIDKNKDDDYIISLLKEIDYHVSNIEILNRR